MRRNIFFGAERVRINKLLGTWRVTNRLSARKAGRRGSNLFSVRPDVEAAGALFSSRVSGVEVDESDERQGSLWSGY
jgi:hypothetical protein